MAIFNSFLYIYQRASYSIDPTIHSKIHGKIIPSWWLSLPLWGIWVRQLPSVGMIFPFPTEWQVIKFMFQSPPIRSIQPLCFTSHWMGFHLRKSGRRKPMGFYQHPTSAWFIMVNPEKPSIWNTDLNSSYDNDIGSIIIVVFYRYE